LPLGACGAGCASFVLGAVFSLGFFNQQLFGLGIKELALRIDALCVQALAAFTKAPLLQARQLEGQGVDLCLLELQLIVLCLNLRTQPLNQLTCIDSSLMLTQRLQLGLQRRCGINVFEHASILPRARARGKTGDARIDKPLQWTTLYTTTAVITVVHTTVMALGVPR
jgi:hypothetical protein